MSPLSTAVLVLAALLSIPASAQPAARPTEAGTLAVTADSTQADSTGTARLGASPEQAAGAEQQAPVPPAPVATLYVFGSGVRVTLPPDWEGASLVREEVGYALYTFRNDAADHPLRGATLRLERVTGLNALLRERWLRGQTAHGYHGTRPVGPATAPVPGFAVEVDGPGVRGISVFTQRSDGMWAVQVVAPAAIWNSRRDEVRALLAAAVLP